MAFAEMKIEDFLDVLKTKEPVPGGGGVASLVGGLGIALGNMVGSLTVGKKKYADVEDLVKELMDKSEALMNKFKSLMDEDAEAFAPLAKAYSLPKETPEEIAYKEEVMEKALKAASLVPLEIMKTCLEAIDLVEDFAKYGSRLAISDAGCAATLLEAALKAAALNVFINTKSFKNRAEAEEMNAFANNAIEEYSKKASAIYESVKAQLV